MVATYDMGAAEKRLSALKKAFRDSKERAAGVQKKLPRYKELSQLQRRTRAQRREQFEKMSPDRFQELMSCMPFNIEEGIVDEVFCSEMIASAEAWQMDRFRQVQEERREAQLLREAEVAKLRALLAEIAESAEGRGDEAAELNLSVRLEELGMGVELEKLRDVQMKRKGFVKTAQSNRSSGKQPTHVTTEYCAA